MYEELNLAQLPRITGVVVRGYITRYAREESWAAELIALPVGTIAQDADAICHYCKGADGRFYEYFGWAPSTEEAPIYVCAADHVE